MTPPRVYDADAFLFDRSSFQAGCPTLGSRGELWPVTGQVGEQEEKGGVGEEQEDEGKQEEQEEEGKEKMETGEG